MLVLPHPRFGSLLPTFFFAETADAARAPVAWVSRSYLHPARFGKYGYSVITAQWWRTLLTDLTVPLDVIYSSFDRKSTRYPLRQAEKRLSEDNRWCIEPPSSHSAQDSAFVMEFYHRKGIDTSMTLSRLESSPTRPYWLSSRASYEGKLIALRTYICDESAGITRSLYAVTADLADDLKSEAGLISRMLCWQDMQWFKRQGYRIYDWGGISKHGELAGIDSFKRSFGGSPAIIWDALICKKPLAPVLRAIWKLRFGKPPEVEEYHEDASEETQDAV